MAAAAAALSRAAPSRASARPEELSPLQRAQVATPVIGPVGLEAAKLTALAPLFVVRFVRRCRAPIDHAACGVHSTQLVFAEREVCPVVPLGRGHDLRFCLTVATIAKARITGTRATQGSRCLPSVRSTFTDRSSLPPAQHFLLYWICRSPGAPPKRGKAQLLDRV